MTIERSPRSPRLVLPLLLLLLLVGYANGALHTGSKPLKSYAPYPTPDAGYLTDLAQILDRSQEEQIEQLLWTTEEQTGVEIAVLIIRSQKDYPGTSATIESFAREIFDRYGVGNQPANNGVLLLVAIQDRQARIELGAGYGQAHNAQADQIMQNTILPRFKKQDYAGGIQDGVKHIVATFAKGQVDAPNRSAWFDTLASVDWTSILIFLAAVILLISIAVSLFRNGKRGWGWVVVGLLILLLIGLVMYLATNSRREGRGNSSSWSPGGFGGGFGGGSSGGGGATGRW